MVLYLKMAEKTWAKSDYTDSATYDLTGTVYDENSLATTRDISGFTGTFRLLNLKNELMYSSSVGLTLNADGTFLMKFAQGSAPYITGNAKVRLRLEVSGSRLTAVGVNGSDMVFFERD
mgnify:FL=1|jgi:hypothetical protein